MLGRGFDPSFAGERVPTLSETIAAAHELDLVVEIEIKEKLNLAVYTEGLRAAVADPRDLDRLMMISFDHACLKAVKAAIPTIRAGGIVHEKFPDPVAIARMSNLDELCIDLDDFDLAGAAALRDRHPLPCLQPARDGERQARRARPGRKTGGLAACGAHRHALG
jgi:glycerophosphoryl diester phosphodiesterase